MGTAFPSTTLAAQSHRGTSNPTQFSTRNVYVELLRCRSNLAVMSKFRKKNCFNPLLVSSSNSHEHTHNLCCCYYCWSRSCSSNILLLLLLHTLAVRRTHRLTRSSSAHCGNWTITFPLLWPTVHGALVGYRWQLSEITFILPHFRLVRLSEANFRTVELRLFFTPYHSPINH